MIRVRISHEVPVDPAHGFALPLRHRLGGYLEFAPPRSLRRTLESVWIHRTPDDLVLPPGCAHRVLPDPALNLAFVARRDRAGRVTDGRLILMGAKTRPHMFSFQPGSEISAVKVKLEWARPLLGLDPSDHDDRVDPLDACLRDLAASLLDVLADSRSAPHAATILAAFLAPAAPAAPASASPVAARALDLVRRSRGRIPVERLAAHLGLSVRHLHRTVRRDAGVALKPFARVHRFLQAMTRADSSSAPEWARLSVETGFSDQSHLVRESRALAGAPAAALHHERRSEDRLFNRG